MGYCPNCRGQMKMTEIACPHCGYDFPPREDDGAFLKRPFPYSPLADVALIVATACTAVGCLVAAVAIPVLIWHRQWLNGLVIVPLEFFVLLGTLVVFLRIQMMDRD